VPPIYVYSCEACEKQEEHHQRMSDRPLVVCSSCKEPKLKKIIAGSNFALKGNGWAKDNYGIKPPAPKANES
jgi:putative FmdB family regulatory protein